MRWKLWLAGFSALSRSFHSHHLPDNILFLHTREVITILEHKAGGPCFREVNMEAAWVFLRKVHFLLVFPLLSQGLPLRSLSSHLRAAYCFRWLLDVSLLACTLHRLLTRSQEQHSFLPRISHVDSPYTHIEC